MKSLQNGGVRYNLGLHRQDLWVAGTPPPSNFSRFSVPLPMAHTQKRHGVNSRTLSDP